MEAAVAAAAVFVAYVVVVVLVVAVAVPLAAVAVVEVVVAHVSLGDLVFGFVFGFALSLCWGVVVQMLSARMRSAPRLWRQPWISPARGVRVLDSSSPFPAPATLPPSPRARALVSPALLETSSASPPASPSPPSSAAGTCPPTFSFASSSSPSLRRTKSMTK